MTPVARGGARADLGPGAFLTLGLAALVSLILLGLGEAVARPLANGLEDQPLSAELRQNVDALTAFAQDGPLDCVFVGPSSVRRGIDPDAFSRAYAGTTGRLARCFSFAIGGIDNATTVVLARAVDRAFQPSRTIVGLMPLERTQWAGRSSSVARDPWIETHTGTIAAARRLVARSALFRVATGATRQLPPLPVNGFTPNRNDPRQGFAASRLSDSTAVARLTRKARFSADIPTDALPEGSILLLLPISPPLAAFVPELPTIEREFLTRAASVGHSGVSALHVPLPAEQWADPLHLGGAGAAAFSTWLGGAIGAADIARGIPVRSPAEACPARDAEASAP